MDAGPVPCPTFWSGLWSEARLSSDSQLRSPTSHSLVSPEELFLRDYASSAAVVSVHCTAWNPAIPNRASATACNHPRPGRRAAADGRHSNFHRPGISDSTHHSNFRHPPSQRALAPTGSGIWVTRLKRENATAADGSAVPQDPERASAGAFLFVFFRPPTRQTLVNPEYIVSSVYLSPFVFFEFLFCAYVLFVL